MVVYTPFRARRTALTNYACQRLKIVFFKINNPNASKKIEIIVQIMIFHILILFLGIDCKINDKPIVEVNRKKTQVSLRSPGPDITSNPKTIIANPIVAFVERFWFVSLGSGMVFTLWDFSLCLEVSIVIDFGRMPFDLAFLVMFLLCNKWT